MSWFSWFPWFPWFSSVDAFRFVDAFHGFLGFLGLLLHFFNIFYYYFHFQLGGMALEGHVESIFTERALERHVESTSKSTAGQPQRDRRVAEEGPCATCRTGSPSLAARTDRRHPRALPHHPAHRRARPRSSLLPTQAYNHARPHPPASLEPWIALCPPKTSFRAATIDRHAVSMVHGCRDPSAVVCWMNVVLYCRNVPSGNVGTSHKVHAIPRRPLLSGRYREKHLSGLFCEYFIVQ